MSAAASTAQAERNDSARVPIRALASNCADRSVRRFASTASFAGSAMIASGAIPISASQSVGR